MEISKYILASKAQALLTSEFRAAMENSDDIDNFIDKPTALKKASRMKYAMAPTFKEMSSGIGIEIERRKSSFLNTDKVSQLAALDYAIQSMITETRLKETGAIFGDEAYNFCIDNLKIPKQVMTEIERVALDGFRLAKTCSPYNSPRNETERFLNAQNLEPNGARVDIIQTPDGPKIIEVNFQWVDGIQALDALRLNSLGNRGVSPLAMFSNFYKDRRNLGIIFLNSASGSRELGEYRSLEIMARRLTSSGDFSRVEIINPESVRPEYLSRFGSLYIDGDPKMISDPAVPDWLTIIYDKGKSSNTSIFPTWNPQYDKKTLLIEASERWPDIFAKTYDFSEIDRLGFTLATPDWVLKGDGFSSKQVAMSQTDLFESVYEDAILFPGEYVLQPKLQSTPLPPIWAFDTSSSKPVYLENPNCKYNVWIINDKVAGMTASLSDEEMISDKDFNTVPIPC